MRPGFPIRLVVAALVAIAVAAVLVAVLMATDTMLSIWQRLDSLAPWASAAYLFALVAAAGATAWFVWRLLAGTRPNLVEESLDRDQIEQRIDDLQSQGIDPTIVKHELNELDQRMQEGRLYLAVFGEISTGKSSLINALLPDAKQTTGIVGGTTADMRQFEWQASENLTVNLIDLPGFSQNDGVSLGDAARREAQRAHVVIYVCDSDLTRTQYAQLATLAELQKPTIIALNKADQYDPIELEQIRSRILDRVTEAAITIEPIQAGGIERVTVAYADGTERVEQRQRPPDVSGLVAQITELVTGQESELQRKHELTGLALAAAQLRAAEDSYRQQAAETMVQKYSRRAMVGALAAITPGSDLVIQGALATRLLHQLCALYGVSIREVDLDQFLTLAGGKLKRTTALVLAVAGNGLKAFPGIGTVAGGLVHAVAYGMIFDSLGRSVADALAKRQDFVPSQLADQFEEQLIGTMETRAGHFVRLALAQLRNQND